MQVPIAPGAPIHIPIQVHGVTGVREMDALLDTGSLFMTIPVKDAVKLGYRLDGAPLVTIVTANGLTKAPRITLARVTLAEFEATSVPALCLDIAAAGASSLLGLSFLSHINFSVDNKAGTLTITDP